MSRHSGDNDKKQDQEYGKELQFAKTLEEVRHMAREQGNVLGTAQIQEAFANQSLSEEQFSLIYDYLEKYHIGVDEALDPEECLTKEEQLYLQGYIRGVGGFKRYGEEEKKNAFSAAMVGDDDGRRKLMQIYLPKVAEIAKLYAGQGVLLEDLIGEGNVILAAALTGSQISQDPEAILIRRVMDAMEELIAQGDRARKTDSKMEERVNAVAEAAASLAEALRRKVTVEELALESSISEGVIREAIRISGNAIEDIEDEDRAERESK